MAKKDLKKTVKKWCDEEGIFDRENEDSMNKFNFTITYPVNVQHRMNVVQPSDSEKVIVMSGTRFESEMADKMRGLSREEFEELMWDLRFTLGPRPTEFDLGRSGGILESFLITSILYPDGMTKDSFMAAIRDVYKSKLLATWKIQQRLK